MELRELVKHIKYQGKTDSREISAITYDSRKVKPGTLFVAISGIHLDGHDFIPQAIENGAAAILSNGRQQKTRTVPILRVKDPRLVMSQLSAHFYNNPSQEMNVVGVTGTNGKTSITHILYHILQTRGMICGTLGTLGFQTPSGIMSTGFTTPESVELQQMLQTLKMAGVNNVIMEISSHALELHRVDDVDVDVAVFSNLTPEHLDFHKDMESYFTSKLKLFKRLSDQKTAVINLDDPYGDKIISSTAAKVFSYGLKKKADLYPIRSEFNLNGIQAILKYKDTEIEIDSPLIGEYNLTNIMAAVASSIILGIPVKTIEKSLQNLPPIPGRLERIPCDCPGKVYIDYAHTPDAFEKLFSNLVNLSEDNINISVVFGCGGNRDQNKREQMAGIAEKYASFSYITTDNPRTESLDKINSDITQGFTGNKFDIILDRESAIQAALGKMDDNSILLVLGKGREKYQEIGTEKITYSDIDVISRFQNAG